MMVSDNDKKILRDLAKRQYEVSQTPEMSELKALWYQHNDCKPSRPVITVELYTFADEVIPGILQCEGEFARQIEARLRSNLLNHEVFKDDTVVPDHWGVPFETWFTPFGIPVKVEQASGNSLGHHFVEVLHDLQDDFHLLKKSDFGIRKEEFEKKLAFFQDLFDGCIPVSAAPVELNVSLTQNIVHIMSMENMFLSIYDYPELFQQMLDSLTDDYLEYFRMLEKNHFILPTTQGEHLCQGTYNFTKELPSWDEVHKRPFTTHDVWGYMDSQETCDISPDMFEEFIFPYYQKIACQYGALSYGCCEPVHPFWEKCISKFDNLRKVSISAWCNEEYMGEQLRGKNIVYLRKPSPNFLGVGSLLDEDALRSHIRRTLTAAKGCTLEFSQRDVYSLHGPLDKVTRYVEIVREECQKHYCP